MVVVMVPNLTAQNSNERLPVVEIAYSYGTSDVSNDMRCVIARTHDNLAVQTNLQELTIHLLMSTCDSKI